jgi:uncharacterized protein
VAGRSPQLLARRYVAWLGRRTRVLFAASLLALVASVYLIANHLPLYADFSYLLPQDTAAVRDLRKLEARVKSADTVLVIVQAPDAAARESATRAMLAGIEAKRSPLIERVVGDDTGGREFFLARRHLMVELPELEGARDALRARVDRAKLEANPLYIDLGADDDDDPDQAAAQLEELRAKRREAEDRLARPTNVSADGRIARIEVMTRFPSTDAKRGEALLATLAQVRAEVRGAHPDVDIGITGGVVTALAEHRAIAHGILLSVLVTGLLVAVALALFFRSARQLALLVGTVATGTAITFGSAVFTVGHLNAATAFLGAIIAGNGINYGILLIARYLEERRRHDPEDALAVAMAGTLRPTAVASLGAAIAYGSLAATSFRGFADFAVIGAIGMLVCWTLSYTLLPALMLRFGRGTRVFDGNPFIGTALVRLLGFRRPQLVIALSTIVLLGAGLVTYRYLASDPFEYDIKQLRSRGDDARQARSWMQISDRAFGRGISGRTFIAADHPDQVPAIVAALREIDRDKPAAEQTIGTIDALPTYVPRDQDARLAVLAEIRAMIDEAIEDLEGDERRELAELRPPDELAAFTAADLPASVRDKFTEKDGRLGLLIAIRPAEELDEWNGQDLIRFSTAIRELQLANGETVTTSGASVIFADIITAIERDGPLVTAVAIGALVVMVLLLVGRNLRAVAVLVGTLGGSLLMIAVCALIGIKVNFLDFIALPITLGLGVDYAINVAHRQDHADIPDPISTLRTSGAAVFICSLTTMIGYGSLLVSDNLAIRGFGTASLIGELTTLLTALIIVPAMLVLGHRRASRRADPVMPAEPA